MASSDDAAFIAGGIQARAHFWNLTRLPASISPIRADLWVRRSAPVGAPSFNSSGREYGGDTIPSRIADLDVL